MSEKIKTIEVAVTDDPEDDKCKTFIIHNEDHTLGNGLRYMVMKNPDTEFCGYSVPHPSDFKINFRIQTTGTPATDVLKKGLEDLEKASDHILTTFEKSVNKYKNENPDYLNHPDL